MDGLRLRARHLRGDPGRLEHILVGVENATDIARAPGTFRLAFGVGDVWPELDGHEIAEVLSSCWGLLGQAGFTRHLTAGEIVDAYTEHDQRQMARQARKPQQHQRGRRG